MPGDWMSASITPTRLPDWASKAATLAVVFDLPVPPRKLWMETMVDKPFLPGAARPSFPSRRAKASAPGARVVGVSTDGAPTGRVLVVDDDRMNRVLLTHSVEQVGHEVRPRRMGARRSICSASTRRT